MKILSPKVLYTVFFALIVAFSAWFWRFSPASTEAVYSKNDLAASAGQNAFIDTDKDGLQDWEEVLWKTDPKNPDSDGDGMKDGDESVASALPKSGGGSETGENLGAPPNLTEALGKALANSLGPRILEEGGLDNISLSDIQGAASYLPTADALLGDLPKITKESLKISDKNDAETVKKYFNDLHYLAYEKAFAGLETTDILAFMVFLKSEDPKFLEKIDPVIQAFEKSIANILELPIPMGYEDFAIQEIGILYKMKRADEIIRNAHQDLLAAGLVVEMRFKQEEELNTFHQEYKKMLTEKGIIFNSGDNGYKLFP